MQILGIDIGGSGIKGALVDLETGEFASKRIRIETPPSFQIDAVTETIATLVSEFNHKGAVGVGFPAAVANGIVLTPPTAHHVAGWVGQSVNDRFSETTGCSVMVLNDADAAGLAEMRFGAGRGVDGVVITVTLGTGVGGGLFMDSKLVPNLEIGKLSNPCDLPNDSFNIRFHDLFPFVLLISLMIVRGRTSVKAERRKRKRLCFLSHR